MRITLGTFKSLAILLLFLILVIPAVFPAGRVLFPGSEVRSGVRSEVRPGQGGSGGDFWLWRSSTTSQSERPRLLSLPSRRPLQGPRQLSRPPQRLNSQSVLRQTVQLLERQPTGPPGAPVTPSDRRPALARLVIGGDQFGPQISLQSIDPPIIPVRSIPSVNLEGLGPALSEVAVHRAPPGGDEASPAVATSSQAPPTSRALPTPAASTPPKLQGEDVTQMLTSVSPLTSLADADGARTDPSSTRISSVVSDAIISEEGEGGGEDGRKGRRLTDVGSGWTRPWPSEIITDSAPESSYYTRASYKDAIPETSGVKSPSIQSQTVFSVTSLEETDPPAVTSHIIDTIPVTSQILTIDSGSPPVYFNNDVISSNTAKEQGEGGPRDDTNTERILAAIASLKGGDPHGQRHVNDVEGE